MSKHLKLPTLLVISKNPSLRFWVKKHLNERFFILEATKNGNVLATIQHTPLDLVILDGTWEESDPLALCREMQPALHSDLTPILLVTGRLNKAYREEALEAGVTDFLSDQLDLEELENRMAAAEKAAATREKTTGISAAIPTGKKAPVTSSFKNKLILPDQALQFIAEAKKKKCLMSLLLLRIDEFEALEKELGDRLTDQLLAPLMRLLTAPLKAHHLLIPSSHGRFILLLQNIAGESAKAFATTLQTRVQANRFKTDQGEKQVTLSIVFSPFDPNEAAFHQMVKAAIDALSQQNALINTMISLSKESP